MIISDIEDDNCMVEVYLHYLMKHGKFEADKIGHMKDDMTFGIYHVWDNKTGKYCVLLTDLDYYYDGRAKKKLTKEKRSAIFLVPTEPSHRYMTEDNLNRVLNFFNGSPCDMKMSEIKKVDFIEEYLNMS